MKGTSKIVSSAQRDEVIALSDRYKIPKSDIFELMKKLPDGSQHDLRQAIQAHITHMRRGPGRKTATFSITHGNLPYVHDDQPSTKKHKPDPNKMQDADEQDEDENGGVRNSGSSSSSGSSGSGNDGNSRNANVESNGLASTREQLAHNSSAAANDSQILQDGHAVCMDNLYSIHRNAFINQVHFLCNHADDDASAEMDRSSLWETLKKCTNLRSHVGFSADLSAIVALLREDQADSITHPGLSSNTVKQCDDMIKQLQQAEQSTKELVDNLLSHQNSIQNAQREELNLKVAQRDQLRANCMQMLEKICQHLDTITKGQQPRSTRLQSIQSLLSKVRSHADLLTAEQMNHASQMDTDAYTRFLSHAESKLTPYVRRTNEAYEALKHAMEEEANALDTYLSAHHSDIDILREGILQRGKEFVEQHNPNAKHQQSKMHFEELQSHYASLRHNIAHTLNRKVQLDTENWRQSTEDTESELRDARRNLLKLKYQRDELEIDGANSSFVAGISQQIEAAQIVVEKLQSQLQQMESTMGDLAADSKGFPELQLAVMCQGSHDARIPNRIVDTKLEMKLRAFSDYELVQRINSRVCVVKYGAQMHILKQFSFSDDMSVRQFIKEVNALHKLNHPSIVRIQGFFIEAKHIYVQMEYQGDCNMKDWLMERQQSDYELRVVFHQLSHALTHMHERGIVHCDLKFENIIMRGTSAGSGEALRPVVIDFDVSKDILGSLTTTTTTILANNNVSVIAPELVQLMSSNVRPSDFNFASIDWWSLGILLYRATLRQEPMLLPEQDGISAAQCENLYLRDLLQRLLKRDPRERITPNEIISHAYFSASVEGELRQMGQLVSTEVKLDAFNRFLFHYKGNQYQAHPHKLRVQISRARIVKDVLHVFSRLEEVPGGMGLLQTFRIDFLGEDGVDMGGITSDMYNCFLREVVKPEYGLFESGSDDSQFHLPIIMPPKGMDSSHAQKKRSRHLNHLEAIGKALAKSIYDQTCIPELFPPSFWKYLRGGNVEFNFRDLEIYDPDLALSLTKMITCDGVDSWQLDFEDVGEPGKPITDQNKVDYVRRKTFQVLLGCRIDALDAIKRGFQSIRELNAQLRVFSYRELMYLVHGQAGFVDIEAIIEMLRFEEFHPQSRTPHVLLEVLREFNQMQVKLFVEFVTGSSGINDEQRNSGRVIVVRRVRVEDRNALPVAHTCAWIMDIPDYGENKQLTRDKLLLAFSSIGSGFHIA